MTLLTDPNAGLVQAFLQTIPEGKQKTYDMILKVCFGYLYRYFGIKSFSLYSDDELLAFQDHYMKNILGMYQLLYTSCIRELILFAHK